MAAIQRTAQAIWEGDLARGAGWLSGASAVLQRLPYSLAGRIGSVEEETNPEELLAAAHSGCFAMALTNVLSQAGTPPERLTVSATCTLDEVEGVGRRIVASDLVVRGEVPGVDAEAFASAASAADERCPFSALIRASGRVSVDATLV